jgi:8-oxo-dGTP pyrophosphatase MutT (NUDIX family)
VERVERYTAAGGVIVHGELVLVLRWPSRDEIRLPKGHVEPGETVREAAVREAAEESGYLDIEIVTDLGHQRITFQDGDRRVVRTERYFLMTLLGEPGRARGRGESKFDPVWLTWEAALNTLTFEVEQEWVRRARRLVMSSDIDAIIAERHTETH